MIGWIEGRNIFSTRNTPNKQVIWSSQAVGWMGEEKAAECVLEMEHAEQAMIVTYPRKGREHSLYIGLKLPYTSIRYVSDGKVIEMSENQNTTGRIDSKH